MKRRPRRKRKARHHPRRHMRLIACRGRPHRVDDPARGRRLQRYFGCGGSCRGRRHRLGGPARTEPRHLRMGERRGHPNRLPGGLAQRRRPAGLLSQPRFFDRTGRSLDAPYLDPARHGRRAACARLRTPPQLRQRDVHLPEERMATGRSSIRSATCIGRRRTGAPCASTRHSHCRSTRALRASRGSISPAPPRHGHGLRTSRRRRARGRTDAMTCARTPRAPSRS